MHGYLLLVLGVDPIQRGVSDSDRMGLTGAMVKEEM